MNKPFALGTSDGSLFGDLIIQAVKHEDFSSLFNADRLQMRDELNFSGYGPDNVTAIVDLCMFEIVQRLAVNAGDVKEKDVYSRERLTEFTHLMVNAYLSLYQEHMKLRKKVKAGNE